ncbi:unnamed protein product [Mytilus edulis]|uniref:SEA domain-containing protein n=1 Tax=Mytilus edulis TaxID=6550 RepID=A0A8S3TCJ5_MYTED|nr:unnamed protein product [Mytilus edulis]
MNEITNIITLFFSIYEIYLGCIQSAQEEKTGKGCKRTSLATWMPNIVTVYFPNIKDTQLRACSISNDKDICNDPKTLEVAAVNTTCSIAIIFSISHQRLHAGGGDVCLNYTNYMYVQEEEDCTVAIGQERQQDPSGLLLTNINYCNDIQTLDLMVNTTKCGYYVGIMASYPSCLNARMFLDCMTGLFPSCDEYMFAQTMVNSIIKNRIPQTFNPMTCFGVSGPSKFVAEVKINATWDEDLSSAETSKYRQLKSTFEQQAWMLFSNKVLFLKDHIQSIDVLSFKPGSIIVEFAVIIKTNSDFYKALQLEDFRQELLRAIKELKMNPPTAPNYFTSVDVDSINITGSDDGHPAPDCNSMTYISSIVDSQCESAKSRLRMVNKDRKCR